MQAPLIQTVILFTFIAILVFTAISGLINLLPEPITNDQIIEETKKCREAGMDTSLVKDDFHANIIKVQCTPKNQ